MNSFIVIIPARLQSSRLPHKVLADIGGKAMVVRVAEQARLSSATAVYVAADDDKIIQAVTQENIQVIKTDTQHTSGTERLGEAIDKLAVDDEAIIINVQGDEPFINPLLINKLAHHLASQPTLPMVTACYPIKQRDLLLDPNTVKVVLNKDNQALYFSRAPIPYARDTDHDISSARLAYHHIGIYGYRAKFLRHYQQLSPSPLESIEALEQLRILWHGFPIGVYITETEPAKGVDTATDLLLAQQKFSTDAASTTH